MIKISRKIEYSLMALKHMVGKLPGELTTSKEVCDVYKTPFDVTAKVMQTLAQNSVLRSVQGAHGGYQVQKDLSKMSFQDLVEIIEGPVEIARCLHRNDRCDLSPTCNIVSPIETLNQRMREIYSELTVLDLIIGPSGEGSKSRVKELAPAEARS